MQFVDLLVMHGPLWLQRLLENMIKDGYVIDSVVVSEGEVVIVYHRAPQEEEL